VAAFEGQMASLAPSWLAYDMRLMMAGIHSSACTVRTAQRIGCRPCSAVLCASTRTRQGCHCRIVRFE
jgi:hypothetical protein